MRNAVDLSVFAPDDEDRLRTRRSLGVADGQLLIGTLVVLQSRRITHICLRYSIRF